MTDETERKLRVLMHESEQVHDTIGRALNTANTLYGLVLPVAFTVLAFTANKTGDVHFPAGLLCTFFAGVVAATLIYNAGLWVEISRYLRFKYTVIYPELHALGGIGTRDNLGMFLAREHRARGAKATLAFHATALTLTIAVMAAGVWIDRAQPWILAAAGVAAVLLAVAIWITFSSMLEVKENLDAVITARP